MNCNDKICDWYSFQLEVNLHLIEADLAKCNGYRILQTQLFFPEMAQVS